MREREKYEMRDNVPKVLVLTGALLCVRGTLLPTSPVRSGSWGGGLVANRDPISTHISICPFSHSGFHSVHVCVCGPFLPLCVKLLLPMTLSASRSKSLQVEANCPRQRSRHHTPPLIPREQFVGQQQNGLRGRGGFLGRE